MTAFKNKTPDMPRYLFEVLLLAAVYFCTAIIGQQLAIPPGNVTPVWIPSGIVLAAVLLRGYYIYPGIWLGAFAGNVWAYIDFNSTEIIYRSLLSGAMNGLGDTFATLTAVYCILRVTSVPELFDKGRHAMAFIVFGAFMASGISACFGVTSLCFVGFVDWSSYGSTWVTWWVGDAVGVLLVAPLILLMAKYKGISIREGRGFESIFVAVVLLGLMAVSLLYQGLLPFEVPLLVILPILLWSVMRLGESFTYLNVTIVAVFTILNITLSTSINEAELNVLLIELQLVLAVVTVTVLLLNATTNELTLARAKAFEASEAKSRFLSHISHELRTPLHAILGLSQLQSERLKPETLGELKSSPQRILSAGKHLLFLINNILDITNIESNKVKVDRQNCSLDSVLDTSIILCDEQLKAFNIELVKTPADFYVLADETRLIQVFTNLISNAIKYNRNGGNVIIDCEKNVGGSIVVRVKDTGVGIALSEQENLFVPFNRSAFASTNQIGGAGIGLALTKHLVEKMGGAIGLESEEGAGSTFTITLKEGERIVKVENEFPAECEAISSGDQLESYDDFDSEKALLHRETILYIEDDDDSRTLMKMALRKFPNLKLLICSSAEEGIRVAQENKPEIIFLDLNLPGIDGLEAMKVMKQMPELAESKIIAISASAYKDKVEQALADGFDFYFIKPVHYKKLYQIVESSLDSTVI